MMITNDFGVSMVMGGTPIAGWFLLGKVPSFEMDDEQGYPHDLGNPHVVLPNTC